MNSEMIIFGSGRGLFFAEVIVKSFGRKVAALVDNNVAKHESIRRKLDEIGSSETKIFTTAEEAFDAIPRSQANIAYVMTPENSHLELMKKSLEAGCHVFLEKPVAATQADALEILRLANTTDKVVGVGFVLRYSQFYRKIKEIIDSGAIGRIVCIQMNERLGLDHGPVYKRGWRRKLAYTGGFINEKCSHDLDLMCWFKESQAQINGVFSYGNQSFCKRPGMPENCSVCDLEKCPWRIEYDESQRSQFDSMSARPDTCVYNSDSDVTDHQMVNVIFSDGTQGIFTAISMSADPGRDIIVHGTDGYLDGHMEKGVLRMCNYWDGELKDIDLGLTDGHGGGDNAIISEFWESIETGNKPLASVEAGVRASLVAFAANKSLETEAVVKFSNMYNI